MREALPDCRAGLFVFGSGVCFKKLWLIPMFVQIGVLTFPEQVTGDCTQEAENRCDLLIAVSSDDQEDGKHEDEHSSQDAQDGIVRYATEYQPRCDSDCHQAEHKHYGANRHCVFDRPPTGFLGD
ncbi:hypothetical protein [Burkholderia thailandensis]|uniref:hypothetical protein n=1 Tax=Burkholderia thailandensis TaxID=57975 RepID=UPI001186EF33|nr:hypothetical protein [Burkholderia thailandensis]MBF3770386.1 hypothetical protein [Burkholderia pseudomallei]